MKTILIVDDEEKIREVVASYLQNEKHMREKLSLVGGFGSR
jgi:CheY-like chemotaxis protein